MNARRLWVSAGVCIWAVAVSFAAEPQGKVIYSCDFERDAGMFRLEAHGAGCVAQLDRTTAHGGNQSVKLVDGGRQDAQLVWMHEWENWGRKTDRASLQWARHWNPDRPVRLRKGFTYEVRAYVKTVDVHGAGIMLSVWGKSASPVRGHTERYSPIVSGTRDWGWISARVACTAGDGELASITIAPLGRGTMWVDDLSIVELPEAGFESINGGRYPPMKVQEVRAETGSCLALEFIGDLNCVQAERPENWTVQSDEDAGFGAGVRPERIGRIQQPDNPDGSLWWMDTYRHTVYLLLPQRMQTGKHYRISMLNVGSEREEFPIVFDESRSISRSIKANQFGYLPTARKYAYVGAWLGSAGWLPLESLAREFLVVDAKGGQVVFRGTPKLRMRHDQKEDFSTSTLHSLTGEDVYELDFSPLDRTGRYFVQVPGVGRSLAFSIGEDVYRPVFYDCARAIFHQRCGIEIAEPQSPFTRKACHRGPAIEISATIVDHGSEDQDELVKKDPTIKTGRVLDVWGGYHDAADV